MAINAEKKTINIPVDAYVVSFSGDNAKELDELKTKHKLPDVQSVIALALTKLKDNKNK